MKKIFIMLIMIFLMISTSSTKAVFQKDSNYQCFTSTNQELFLKRFWRARLGGEIGSKLILTNGYLIVRRVIGDWT